MDHTKRNFLKRLIHNVISFENEESNDFNYFESYETCYPLISEYSYFLDDEVNELGINTEGKSNLDLVEEVYEKKGRG